MRLGEGMEERNSSYNFAHIILHALSLALSFRQQTGTAPLVHTAFSLSFRQDTKILSYDADSHSNTKEKK